MHKKCFLFLILFMLVGISTLIAQKSGATYIAIAKRYENKGSYDVSRLYYDSAFQQYAKQKQYSSATLSYNSLEKYLLDSGYVDSTHYYMRLVYDATQKLPRYDNNKNILTLKKSLAGYYFKKHILDSTAIVLKSTLPVSIRNYGKLAQQNTGLYAMQSLVDFYKGDIRSASSWMKTALDANRDKTKMGEMWIEYIEYNILAENEKALYALTNSSCGRSTI